MSRLPIYSTAFSLSHGPKRPRVRDKSYLSWLHEMPCVITGSTPVEAAHLRIGSLAHGKPHGGAGIKPDDLWCLPLSPEMHRDQHAAGDELRWWSSHGIDDPFALCALLFAAYFRKDDDAGRLVIENAHLTCARQSA